MKIRLLTHPGLVLYHFTQATLTAIFSVQSVLVRYAFTITLLLCLSALVLFYFNKIVTWYGWWLLMGVVSSVGLGTGLHTFILFLGPFIAQNTITAYNCNSLNFSNHGSRSFVCSDSALVKVSLLNIAFKALPETVVWGLGTAIGELPPYFMARTGFCF
jgi:hypothetical protein